ncbi:Homogentisate geranylgeranyltransferase chloroplastic, partial [Bienertia sinuspersici]
DIPDVDGDKHFGIQSFSVTLGKEKVFWLCIKMLLAGYGCAVALGATSPSLLIKLATVLGHFVLAAMLLLRAQSVDLEDNASIASFYMFIWK